MKEKKTVLWVENELLLIRDHVFYLQDNGYNVEIAEDISEAKKIIVNKSIDLIILDVIVPSGEDFDSFNTKAGIESGLALGRWIRDKYPDIPIIGFSIFSDDKVEDWFRKYGNGFISKKKSFNVEVTMNKILSSLEKKSILPKIFIVHGHDETAKYQLKNYIQNTLNLGEPIILHEQPSLGRTIMEKFEDVTDDIDLVFVLLTPDDKYIIPNNDDKTASLPSDEEFRRARQNVIFEMGFFMAKLQRKSGRVVLLYKGDLELPSDISGVISINISNGIYEAGERIRKEIVGII